MTGKQKEQIAAMRRKGCTYAKIAEAAGLSINTVP